MAKNNPEAKITVKMFNDDFKKGASELKQESSTLSREFKLQSEQMKLTATETEKLEAKITYLSQKQDIARRSVEQSQQAYNEAVRLFGENSRAAQDMARNLDNARIDEARLGNEVELASRSLQEQRRQADQTSDEIEELGNTLETTGNKTKEFGSNMTDAGSKITAGVSVPILGVGAAATASAIEFDNATASIQNSLGITADEADLLKESVKSIWEDGFGGNVDEVSEALIRVKQNMKNIGDGDELERVTKDTILLAERFDADLNEVTRAGNNLMVNFGIESAKAYDLMAKGAQNGLNFSNEMFDNLAEYAPLWADMGYSAEEMFGILQRGTDEGVYNLDYINDVMKEFQIRIQDGSKSTSDAMEGMTKETQDMFYAFQGGEVTVAEMSQQIAKDLATVDNRVDKTALGVSFFGTKWEDLGGDVVLSMLKSNEAMQDFEGAMQGISEVQENTFGQRFQSILRQAQSAFEPLGIVMLEMAERWLPKISSVLETVVNWFTNLSPSIQSAIVIIGGIAAAIGPVLVVFGMIANAIGSLITAFGIIKPILLGLGPAFTVVRTVLTALTGPIGIVIAAVTLLGTIIYKNWDTIKETTVKVFNFLIDFFKKWGPLILSVVSASIVSLVTDITKKWDTIKNTTSVVFNAVKTYLSGVWNGIKSTVTGIVVDLVASAVNTFTNMKNNVTNVFNAIKTTATTIFNAVKNAITNPIETAKKTVLGIIDTIKNAFSKMKITIPKPKLPKIDISMGTKTIAGIDVPYPKFDITWFKTGGVFTKPVVAGNAGFGDVTEAIVPFEGSHAARIAGLIAKQQRKHASVANTIIPPQPIYIQVVSELDGQAVANNQYKYLNGMTTNDYNIGKVVRGY